MELLNGTTVELTCQGYSFSEASVPPTILVAERVVDNPQLPKIYNYIIFY